MGEPGQAETEKQPGSAQDEAADLAVYTYVVRHERTEAAEVAPIAADTGLPEQVVAASVERLLTAGLLERGAADPQALLPVAPESALARRSAPLEAEIRERQEQISHLRSRLDRFSGLFAERRSASDDFQVITTLAEVRSVLSRLGEQCRHEMISVQPGGGARVPEAMMEALGRDRAMLERGVRIRTLYHHTARFNGPSQAYVAAAAALGAEYRTAHELFGRLIVMDRSTAFIPTQGDHTGAVVIREPSTVAYLCEVFEQTWCQASPFADATGRAMEAVARELHRTILRLLAAGLKDEAIARRLGMSLRTARRHIADILEQLEVESRFQAGVAATRAGLLDPDPPQPSA